MTLWDSWYDYTYGTHPRDTPFQCRILIPKTDYVHWLKFLVYPELAKKLAWHIHTYWLEPKMMPIKCWKRIIQSLRNQVDPVTRTIIQMIPLYKGSDYDHMYLYFRYLIDAKWFKQWKKYVGFDAWDAGSVGDETVFPGPIDNTPLCKGETLDQFSFVILTPFKKIRFIWT